MKETDKKTSWEGVGDWYNELVGDKGHYYHKSCILPGVLKLFNLNPSEENAILDLACGQGVLGRSLPKEVNYTGIEISSSLIREAKKEEKNPQREFMVGDVTRPLQLKKKTYTHASIILALQNIESPLKAIQNCSNHLQRGEKFVIVLNHPYFRIA